MIVKKSELKKRLASEKGLNKIKKLSLTQS